MPKLMNREYRNIELAAVDNSDDKYIVEGYASTFNEPYTLYEDDAMTIREVVDSRAFENCDMEDVIFQYNHEGRVFARKRNNTLEVTPDGKGLHIRADLGGTQSGRELFEEIQKGYTDRMSFGFIVDGDARSEETVDNRVIYTRTITSVKKLFDVSAVSLPANEGTSIMASRGLTDGLIDEIKAGVAEKRALELDRLKAKLRLRLMK